MAFDLCPARMPRASSFDATMVAEGAAAVSRQDDELTELLTKLYTIQEDIGAKPASSEEDKREKAQNVATMGRTKKAQAKGSRFLDLKSLIVDRLKTVGNLLKEIKTTESAGYGGDNAKEVIKMQSEVREHLRQAKAEFTEMDGIYKNEARKKKSKFSVEELEVQANLVRQIKVQIDKIEGAHAVGFKRDSQSTSVSLNTKTLYSDTGMSSGGNKTASWSGTGGGVAATEDQRQQIMQLEERDADFDLQLDEIGEGIQDLAEIAALQGEEVKRQAIMLENVNNKMDKVTDRMTGVNTKMKDTLEEIGRSSDKLCVDIMCIVLAIGFGSVIYNYMFA